MTVRERHIEPSNWALAVRGKSHSEAEGCATGLQIIDWPSWGRSSTWLNDLYFGLLETSKGKRVTGVREFCVTIS